MNFTLFKWITIFRLIILFMPSSSLPYNDDQRQLLPSSTNQNTNCSTAIAEKQLIVTKNLQEIFGVDDSPFDLNVKCLDNTTNANQGIYNQNKQSLENSDFRPEYEHTTRGKRESDITFPADDDVQRNGFEVPIAIYEACSNDSSLCENVRGYPARYVASIFNQDFNRFYGLFYDDYFQDPQITNRNNVLEDDDEYLCKSVEKVIYPQAGKTANGDVMWIVNQDNMKQGVRIEYCENPNESCIFGKSFPGPTKCKQEYIFRQLLGIDKNGATVKDLFKIPACCQCVLLRSERSKRSPQDSLADSSYGQSFKIISSNGVNKYVMDHQRNTTNVAETRANRMETDITFPDTDAPQKTTTQPNDAESSEPKCANGSTFCDEVDEYPIDLIESLLTKESDNLTGLLVNDTIVKQEVILNRSGVAVEEDVKFCKCEEELRFPKYMKTVSGSWRFVLNYKNFKQGIRVELCSNAGQPCRHTGATAQNFVCKQKYLHRYLYGINSRGQTEKIPFKVPSCCSCVLDQKQRLGYS